MNKPFRPVSADMIHTEKENLTFSKELHHISEQLNELIQLLKDSAIFHTENKPDEPTPSNNNEVMIVKEAAAMLRISLPKMYEFARSGKIHSIEIGRRVLVSRSSIMALLMEGEESNGNETC